MPRKIAFSPDASVILAASDEGQVFLIDPGSGKRLPTGDTHRGRVAELFCSPDSTEAFSAGTDGTLRHWNLPSGSPLDPTYKFGAAATAADGGKTLLATGTSQGGLQIWQRSDGKLLAEMAHASEITALAWRADEAQLLSASTDATVRLWQADGKSVTDPLKHDATVSAAAYSPEMKRLASGTSSGLLRLFNIDGRPLLPNPLEQRGQITAIAWAPSGKALATGSSSGEIILWEASRGRPLGDPARHDGAVTALAFIKGGELLVSGSEDGNTRFWAADTLKSMGNPIQHAAKLLDLVCSPDGATVATRTSDGRVGHWSTRDGKALWEPVTLEVAAAPPRRVALDPRTFVRVGTDRLVTVGGVTGIFTPLGGDPGKPLGNDERGNLLGLIDSLKRELASAQSTSQQLSADLDTLRQRTAPAADFASGVQQSLDELQLRLSTMRNPVSNFAVRELKLDAGVVVQIAPTGAIEYRFIQPGEEMANAAVSRLSLNVVPLPKDNLAGVWTNGLFLPERPLTDLPELSSEQARQLEGQGMFSIGEFVQVCTRVRAQAYLVALLGVDRTRLALWAQQAGLMILRGVDGRVASTLIGAGLGSFDALAVLPPATVLALYETERTAQPQRNAPAITEATAALWVRAARQFVGLPALDEASG